MLDENLPAFFLKPASSGIKHHRDFFLSHYGSDPAPAYVLQHADPASPSPNHKNCYAAALFDAWNPEVLFGEVLARPTWSQPTLSQEEIRRQGGVPPPPQPILPSEFVVQLYNPDQQVRVELKEGKWGSSDAFTFSMPQDVFRLPSASTLDRGASDPASLATTPKINFVWRREGKLSKDLTCFMTGRSTDTKKKSSRKDPDIAIGLWRQMRELTIYEPNVNRTDMEDPKGLEVVLLLSAVVIKDLYFGSKEQMRETFNISDSPTRKLSAGGRRLSHTKSFAALPGPPNPLTSHPPPQAAQQGPIPNRTPNEVKRNSLPRLQTTPPNVSFSAASKPPPLADARAQWELDAETARLKAEAEREAQEAKRRRREREKADELEARRLQKMMEAEEKEARRKRAEVDKETERLRKLYGVTPVPPQQQQPPRPQQRPQPKPAQANTSRPQQPARPPVLGSNGLYSQPSSSGSGLYMSGGAGNASHLSVARPPVQKKKSSFFGLRSSGEEGSSQGRLNKKTSTMW